MHVINSLTSTFVIWVQLYSILCQTGYFDTVGWVLRPVKTVARITYTVLVETLNPAQSINQPDWVVVMCNF